MRVKTAGAHLPVRESHKEPREPGISLQHESAGRFRQRYQTTYFCVVMSGIRRLRRYARLDAYAHHCSSRLFTAPRFQLLTMKTAKSIELRKRMVMVMRILR
jgi:hypothetical protein